MEGFAGRDRVFCGVGESSWRACDQSSAAHSKAKGSSPGEPARDRQEHGWYDFSGGCAGTALERGDEGGPVCRAPDQADRQRRHTSEQPFPGQPVSMSFSGSLLRTLALAVRVHACASCHAPPLGCGSARKHLSSTQQSPSGVVPTPVGVYTFIPACGILVYMSVCLASSPMFSSQWLMWESSGSLRVVICQHCRTSPPPRASTYIPAYTVVHR